MRFDRKRIHDKGANNMVELAEPQVGRTNLEHRNILRWEDDGGQGIEYGPAADHSNSEVARRNNQSTTLPAKEESE
jgi:hypothetical protein